MNKNAEYENTKILVTGAAGFLGGTICRQLVDRGDDVRAFVLPNDPAMKYVPDAGQEPAVRFLPSGTGTVATVRKSGRC